MKSHLCLMVAVMSLAMLEAGCADNSANSASQMTQYGVSRQVLAEAANMGFSPRERNGKTLFCQNEAKLGSIIAKYRCIDSATLTLDYLRQTNTRRRLEKANIGCYSATC